MQIFHSTLRKATAKHIFNRIRSKPSQSDSCSFGSNVNRNPAGFQKVNTLRFVIVDNIGCVLMSALCQRL